MKPSNSTQAGRRSVRVHTLDGSKDVQGASGMSPRVGRARTSWQTGSIPKGAALIRPVTVPELYQR